MNTSHTPRILVIGGGAGGMAAAAALSRWAGEIRPSVTLLDPAEYHYYQPQWTMVGAGLFPREVTRRPMGDLIPQGVKWVKEAAAEFDPASNSVTTCSLPPR